MFTCTVCHSQAGREETVNKVFDIDSHYVLVDGVPATVCARCGERYFSRETTENVLRLIHGDATPKRSVSMEAYDYA